MTTLCDENLLAKTEFKRYKYLVKIPYLESQSFRGKKIALLLPAKNQMFREFPRARNCSQPGCNITRCDLLLGADRVYRNLNLGKKKAKSASARPKKQTRTLTK